MNVSSRLNLKQRFNFMVFISIIFASCLLIGLMYALISRYTNDYTNHFWREHAVTFSDSVLYSVILGSTNQTETIARNFASENNVLKASVYGNHQGLLAAVGENLSCKTGQAEFNRAFFIDAVDFWCFYSPIIQESFLGHVELIISKTGYQSVMRQLLQGSVVIILLFSLVVYFIVQRLSALFTSTLIEMSALLNKVSQGERGVRVNITGAPEIDSMRETLNTMLAHIEVNEQMLEKSVAERTSALKIALESSETANVYKAQIMSMVSHEMKTPLHAISGYLQLLAERLPAGSEFDDSRVLQTKALARANDLNSLIDNILLNARLEADKYAVSITALDVKPIMLNCADTIRPLLNRNHNELTLEGQDGSFSSDSEVLSHIINNLLSNACKFTKHGKITLAWSMARSHLLIEVKDTGCGIPENYHGKIFDPWWQIDMGLGRKFGGHGLGLSITKHFVQRLGGNISVGPNGSQGTVFTVTIPNAAI